MSFLWHKIVRKYSCLVSYLLFSVGVFCLNGFFSGCGHTGFTMFNCLFSTFLVRLPLVIWFSTLPGVTMLQIGIAAPLASLVQIIIQLIYYRTGRWSRAVVQMEGRT